MGDTIQWLYEQLSEKYDELEAELASQEETLRERTAEHDDAGSVEFQAAQRRRKLSAECEGIRLNQIRTRQLLKTVEEGMKRLDIWELVKICGSAKPGGEAFLDAKKRFEAMSKPNVKPEQLIGAEAFQALKN